MKYVRLFPVIIVKLTIKSNLIYTLKGFDPDNDTLTFDKRPTSDSGVIRIENNGTTEALVYLAKELDRETQDEYSIVLTLSDNHFNDYNYVTQSFLLLVEDINDNSPIFLPYQSTIEIPENSQPGILTTVEAIDADEGAYGQVVYYLQVLEDDNDVFAISTYQGKGILRLTGGLDYENKNLYQLRILAVDRANYGAVNTGTAAILIKIKDIEDQPPEFVKIQSVARISEDAAVGTKVMRVLCVDGDRGINNPIVYELEDNELFAIERYTGWIYTTQILNLDPITGVITIKKAGGSAFDREFMTQQYLTVEAIDNLGEGNRNTAQLIINIEDVNDNAPIFLHRQYETTLLENKHDFEQPLQLEARDIDLNDTENSQITYEIVEGLYISNFFIDPIKGSIKLLKAFDYEELVEHKNHGGHGRMMMGDGLLETHLLVRARDSGIPMLSTVVPVMIYIQDINDNPPIFQKKFYSRSVFEDLPSGSSILQVSAIDRDGSAPNNVIVYRIQTGASDKFVINSETGVLSLAIDGGIGSSQLMNSATINITIEDVNNKWPVLGELPLLYIRENIAVGAELYRIQAYDLDENPILRYKINVHNSEARNEDGIVIQQNEYNYVSAFDLDPITGRLQIAKLIDREKVEHIKLAIIVEDLAAAKGRQQLVEGILSLHILDENDNNPKFKEPFYKRSITENSKNGVQIVQLKAYDNDKNRTITYSLEGNALITQLVHLDIQTGELVVANKIDHEQFQWLNFSIRATDSGVPPRSTLVDVYVTILDENDNNPYFLIGSKNYTISESATIGTRLGTVYASDSDSGDFGKITFLMDRISSQGKFSIDADTGVLSVIDKLDRETKDFYTLVIEAWDNYQFGFLAGESRNAFKQVFVTILDENDNAPEVNTEFPGCIFITEYHELNEKIITIKEIFELRQIDAWTADIYARFSLRNRYGNHSIIIEIYDLGLPSNVINRTLDICISDYNDHAPVFLQPSRNSTVRIPENITVGSLILQVLATDDDIGMNALIKYRLKPDPLGSYKLFELDTETGNLYLKHPLDRNKQKIHEIRIEAYDQGLPTSLATDLDLIIYVRKVNEYEPQFVVDEIFVNFTEHSDPGVERIKLPDTIDKDEVDDLDDPPNRIYYYIIYGNDQEYFHLDPETHILVTTKELDRELQSIYVLYVKASTNCTGNQNALRDNQRIEIEINEKSWKTDYHTQQQTSIYKSEIYNRYKHTRTIRSLGTEGALALPSYSNTSVKKLFTADGTSVKELFPAHSTSVKELFSGDIDNTSAKELFPTDSTSVKELFPTDSTIIKVKIHVLDVNDNPPKFRSKIFTGGITTNANFGTYFMRVEAIDLDEGENAKVNYYQVGEIRQTLSEGLENVRKSPFLVEKETGKIQLNFDPQKDMKGYFDFMVLANDSSGMKDVARVFIYLLREDQKVRFVFRLQTNELRDRVHEFKDRSDHDSLDDNFLAIATQDNGNATTKLYQYTNDLNRHFNVCNHIDKLTNNAHMLARKLETTEL
uniref:Cadherin domain-containing protein n=1 Tax=Glossina brevipalpis TaxID=37001 RepID=A0A1A9WMM0_9MUSC